MANATTDPIKKEGETDCTCGFVHLHTHSHYSLLDGMNKIPDLVKKAKEYGMPAIALTDHGNMHGAIEFYKACKKAGIKPIIGMEAYVANRTRFDKDARIDNKRYHLTLLARNVVGYKNLMKMASLSYMEGYYYKPRIDKDLLKEYSEGIICLSGCPASEFVHYLREGSIGKAKDLINFYISIFGRECVFIEIMRHDEVDWYAMLKPLIMQVAREMNMPLVATWDSHYTCKEDMEAHNTLLAINTNNANFKMTGNYSFISPAEAADIYKDYEDATINTMKVVDLVDIQLKLGDWVFPAFPLPDGKSAELVLREKVYANLSWRYKGRETDSIVIDRIEHELEVIHFKDFSIYMLIVGDLVDFARSSGILTNIRGSVAGSIVTFLLGITTVDPLALKLPFTRFLNRERPSAPDIDMDFADTRRDEVIEYARRKYGRDAVAQIGTFGTMQAKGSVRDVARALGYPYDTGDKIAKLVPEGSQGFPMTLNKAIEMDPDLKALYENDKDTKRIIDLARRIEGSARHVSVHAAGVVISPTVVSDYSPIQLDPKGGKIITQYDMRSVEETGLIKFDFLGIRNLSILADAIERVQKIRGVTVDLEALREDDKLTFEMLARGETMGVFQLSGGGMTKYLKELKPSTIDDINAMVALYRPGPLEMIPEYIRRKHNPKLITFLDPRLETILDRSYGVMVYQDDVMLASIELAGYSWLEADALRKAMGKKIPALMEEQRIKLSAGLLKNGMVQEKIDELWSLIEPFAAYGFNKAHAASYGQLAYRTAYMKAHYPQEYMTAIMTAESGDLDKVSQIIDECRRMGFVILPPDVNESFFAFSVVRTEDGTVSNTIRFGLNNIKNFGEDIGRAVIHARKEGGVFTTFTDFLTRVTHKNLTKKSVEALAMSGAFDSLIDRQTVMLNMDEILTYVKTSRLDNTTAQDSLFGDSDIVSLKLSLIQPEHPTSMDQKLLWEKELLGLYVSGHPLDKYRERLSKQKITIKQVIRQPREKEPVIFGGIVTAVKELITKKNEKMAFLTFMDLTGSVECVVFPGTYREFHELLQPDKVIAIAGTVSTRNDEVSIMIDKAKSLDM